MNDMELLRELAEETPLPGPAELDAARARLVAAIATDPGTYATVVAQVTTNQPYPSTGQPTEPLIRRCSRSTWTFRRTMLVCRAAFRSRAPISHYLPRHHRPAFRWPLTDTATGVVQACCQQTARKAEW
jgi:hypothetical protein